MNECDMITPRCHYFNGMFVKPILTLGQRSVINKKQTVTEVILYICLMSFEWYKPNVPLGGRANFWCCMNSNEVLDSFITSYECSFDIFRYLFTLCWLQNTNNGSYSVWILIWLISPSQWEMRCNVTSSPHPESQDSCLTAPAIMYIQIWLN